MDEENTILTTETDESTTVDSWKDSLPEDLRSSEALKNVADVNELAKQFVNQQPMLGREKLVIPTEDSTDEERREYLTKLGVPETAEDYESPTEGMPEGIEINAEHTKAFFKEALDMGLNKQQAARLIRYEATLAAKLTTDNAEAATAAQAETDVTLRSEWGNAYEQNLGLAKKAVEIFGGAELQDHLNKTGLGNNIAMLRAFGKIGRMVAEDEIIGTGSGQSFAMSPAEANAKINELNADVDFVKAKNDRRNPGHQKALDDLADLYKIAHPQSAA